MAKTVKPVQKGSAKKTPEPAATRKKTVVKTVVRGGKKPVATGKVSVRKAETIRKKPGAKIAGKKTAAKRASKDMTRYRCELCGYIYSPMRGEPHNGIPEGTPFDELPESYVCPICGQQGKGRIGKWGFVEWRPTRYLCSLCNYIYDEKRGEPHRGILPGTKFEDLPDDYICPVCAIDPKIRVRFGKVFKHGFEPLNY